MSIEVTDYIDIDERFSALGIKRPEGFCILPRRLERAKALSDLCHEASALDVKTLFRQTNIPITVYQPEGAKIPYLQENDNTWVGPMLFVTTATLIHNPEMLSVALGVIANYVTDLFRGSPGPTRARLSVVIEQSDSKTTKRISYDGPPDQIKEIAKLIKDIKDTKEARDTKKDAKKAKDKGETTGGEGAKDTEESK